MATIYQIRARRPTDFAQIGTEEEDEATAYKNASRLFANGYDVTVERVTREPIAEWTHGDD